MPRQQYIGADFFRCFFLEVVTNWLSGEYELQHPAEYECFPGQPTEIEFSMELITHSSFYSQARSVFGGGQKDIEEEYFPKVQRHSGPYLADHLFVSSLSCKCTSFHSASRSISQFFLYLARSGISLSPQWYTDFVDSNIM